jgi:pimeloyl-ACP methyl ester carboxylesterase
VVAGHSAGGFATAILAAEHPERFRGAVLTGHGLAFDPAQLVPVVPGIGEIWAARRSIIGDAFSEHYRERAEAVHQIRGTRAAYLTFVRNQYRPGTLKYFRVYEQIEEVLPCLRTDRDSGAADARHSRRVHSYRRRP